MDYMDLLVRKRMALARWRAKKDTQRAKSAAAAALLEPETASLAQSEHIAASHASMESSREASVKKELVGRWKERREAARRAAAERAAERARAEAEQKRIELAERQHFNKLKLELAREAKVCVVVCGMCVCVCARALALVQRDMGDGV